MFQTSSESYSFGAIDVSTMTMILRFLKEFFNLPNEIRKQCGSTAQHIAQWYNMHENYLTNFSPIERCFANKRGAIELILIKPQLDFYQVYRKKNPTVHRMILLTTDYIWL